MRFKRTKILFVLVLAITLIYGIIRFSNSNTNVFNDTASYYVTFNYNDDELKTSNVFVQKNQLVKEPTISERKNYKFDGWYTDSNYINKYNFITPVTSSLDLYAKWDIDYITLTNTITTSTMKANVTIINKSYNMILFIETGSITRSGSGIIFSEANGNYYVLTNQHVSEKDNNYNNQKLTIVDYLGNNFVGTKLHESKNYDLAVIYFKKVNELNVIKVEYKNAKKTSDLIALGQPGGQSNAITYGKILEYNKVNVKDSLVSFPVLIHNAPTAGGSSGGAILNINLKLIGLSFAGSTDSNNNFVQSCAIPAEKINEYLNTYIYK